MKAFSAPGSEPATARPLRPTLRAALWAISRQAPARLDRVRPIRVSFWSVDAMTMQWSPARAGERTRARTSGPSMATMY